MKRLEDVTVVMIDSVSERLAELAIDRTLSQIDANVISYRDSVVIESLKDVEEIMWCDAYTQVTTSHILFIQYDGWVLDGSKWQNAWLQYDYIGARWPWHNANSVGNGGFSLRSTRLMRFLAEHRDSFPVASPEDDTLCRNYRWALEQHGFRWASPAMARDFSFEREAPRPSFGFHGIFNVPKVLDADELQLWMSLAPEYVRAKPEWKEIAS